MKGKASMGYDDKGEASTSRTMEKEEEEEEKKMVILKSKDGVEFKVESTVVKQSRVLAGVAEEAEEEEVGGEKLVRIPCKEVRGEVLELMVKYWKKHHEYDHIEGGGDAQDKKYMEIWDMDFVENMSKELLFEVLSASHYLDSKELMDLTCKTVACIIQEMTVEQVREYFGIVGDFTPEEEAKIRKENEWAFDPLEV